MKEWIAIGADTGGLLVTGEVMAGQPRLLVLRADADCRIGTGHVMRCLALAQEWQDQGGEAVFVGHISAESLRQRLESEGFSVHDLPESYPEPQDLIAFLPWLSQHLPQAGWVVLDGYHFDSTYHQALRTAGWPLLIIDDYAHLPAYDADILVNPNAYADEVQYQTQPQTLVLRGARFAMLRREFCLELGSQGEGNGDRHSEPGKRILVTMGGADQDNITGKVIDALQLMDRGDMEVKIIIGPLNPHRQTLNKKLQQAHFHAELLSSVTDMVTLMHWADLAISAAGSTCWELAALGVPMAVTVLAENQVRVAATLANHNVAVNLGWHYDWQADQAAEVLIGLLESSQKRRVMGQRGQHLVDGRGCKRLTQAMHGYHLSLRPATEDDCEIVFQWANDPLTRAVSFSQEPINWHEHCGWFATRLADHDHIFYIAITPKGLPMAQARFALRGDNEAIISVSLASKFRGVGLGSHLIRLACKQAMAERPLTKIWALIRQDNTSSSHAFSQAGFRQDSTIEVSGQRSISMNYTLDDGCSLTSSVVT